MDHFCYLCFEFVMLSCLFIAIHCSLNKANSSDTEAPFLD